MVANARVVRLVLKAKQENTDRITVLHYATPSDHIWTGAELTALATAFWTYTKAFWKAAVSANVNFESITVTDMDGPFPHQAVYLIPQPEPGVAAGDSLPANVAACISWKTIYASRRTRGRSYLYGAVEAFATGSNWTTAYMTTIGNLGVILGAFVNSGGVNVNLAVYSRLLNLHTTVTSFLIDNIVDSQRRRLPQRGD